MSVLLCDMDTPLAGFDERAIDLCAENGWPMDIAHVGELTKRWVTHHVIDPEHRDLLRAAIRHQPGWFRSLPVVEGAREGLEKCARRFDEVWICTRMPSLEEWDPSWASEKVAWTREHFGFEWSQRLIITPDKSLVTGTLLLDDAPTPAWFARARWKPVMYPTAYNGAGSEWEGLPRWSWDQPIGDLMALAGAAQRFPDQGWAVGASYALEQARGW